MSRSVLVDIPPPFAPLLNPSVRKIVEASGRSSGKSTTNECAAALKMLKGRDNNIWYCRAEKSDIRSTIYSSFVATLQTMGVDRYFKTSLSPLEITCLRNGSKCYFSGINGKVVSDLNATKGFTPQNRSLAMFILDEANEAKASTHITAAETTANKFLQDDGKIIYAYNPPPIRTHWAHTYFDNMVRDGASKIYTTWRDIKGKLKAATIDEIQKMERDDPKHYAYWYLGQMVSLEGLVLFTFRRDRNVVSVEWLQNRIRNTGYQPVYMIYGVDSGIVKDPTAVCAWGVFPDGIMIKLSTFYHEPRKNGDEPATNSMQANMIYDWYRQFYERMASIGVTLPGAYNEVWIFDNAPVTQDLMYEWQGKTCYNCHAVENKNIERDIKRLQNAYYNRFLKILDVPENKPSFDEIDTFSYDENNKIPEGQADHTIDADKYATAHYYYQYMLGG